MSDAVQADGYAVSTLDDAGDGTTRVLSPGGVVRVSPSTHRELRNAGQDDG